MGIGRISGLSNAEYIAQKIIIIVWYDKRVDHNILLADFFIIEKRIFGEIILLEVWYVLKLFNINLPGSLGRHQQISTSSQTQPFLG